MTGNTDKAGLAAGDVEVSWADPAGRRCSSGPEQAAEIAFEDALPVREFLSYRGSVISLACGGWRRRDAMSGAVRAGMPAFGAHRLRHSAACAMVGAKVPMAGIAQALGHRSHVVTAIYARAGIDRLRPLARPWPRTPALPEGEAS